MTPVEYAEKQLRYKPKTQIKSKDLLSTGSTLLNLALSGRSSGGYVKGKVHLVIGDSTAGKTVEVLTALAEATIDPKFDEYRLIYDNGEEGALMDMATFYGPKVAERVEPPAGTKEEPIHSTTVEEFYFHLDDAIKQGPCIYILDSMDVLSTGEEEEQFEKEKAAHKSGKSTGGTYGTEKAKKNSRGLKRVISKLKTNGSILIIICQTRDNIGFGARFNPKTRGGGKSLKFYTTVEIWFSVKEKIQKKINTKMRQQGIVAKIATKKNRITGKEWDIEIPIYWSSGIDDTGSCVDFLVEEGHWKESSGRINAPEFDFKGTREQLIQMIEKEDLERNLRIIVTRVWREVEDKSAIKRKNRYA